MLPPLDVGSNDAPALTGAALVVGAGLMAVLGLVLAEWANRTRTSTLRRLGYLPGPDPGEWTARVDAMRITWRPMRGFTARLGVYFAGDLDLRPRAARGDLDDRWEPVSSSPAAARALVLHPKVREVLSAFPAARWMLRGDELVVEVPRRRVGRAFHDAVLRLALALADAIRAT